MTDVSYELTGRIARVTLDRPVKLNAFTDDMVAELRSAFDRFDDDDEAWCAIVSGNGRAFSSGADVRQRQDRTSDEIARLGGLHARGASIRGVLAGQTRMKPVVAAVHGYAFGAGLKLALYCDQLVAAEGTQFQVTEVSRGLDSTDVWFMLSDRVGSQFASDVCVTGRRWQADEPAAVGFATRIAPVGTHLAVAEELAAQIVTNPPLAVRSVVRARRLRLAELELASSRQADRSLVHSGDFRESVKAYLEKRVPVYRGQ
jgi:enoyl-CoA hydratase/carnithine racemase